MSLTFHFYFWLKKKKKKKEHKKKKKKKSFWRVAIAEWDNNEIDKN